MNLRRSHTHSHMKAQRTKTCVASLVAVVKGRSNSCKKTSTRQVVCICRSRSCLANVLTNKNIQHYSKNIIILQVFFNAYLLYKNNPHILWYSKGIITSKLLFIVKSVVRYYHQGNALIFGNSVGYQCTALAALNFSSLFAVSEWHEWRTHDVD